MFDIENDDVTFGFVVSNDTASEAEIHRTSEITQNLNQMISEREAWEATAYQTSNQQLYRLLAKCYALDWQLDADDDLQRADVDEYAKKLGYKFQAQTPMITKIVRCVFGCVHRSRVSTYSLVLREAKRQKIHASQIPGFIEQAGGVQEIKLSISKGNITRKSRTSKAPAIDQGLAAIHVAETRQRIDPSNTDGLCVLIATQRADGSFELNAVVRDSNVLKAAMAVASEDPTLIAQTNAASTPKTARGSKRSDPQKAPSRSPRSSVKKATTTVEKQRSELLQSIIDRRRSATAENSLLTSPTN